MRRHVRRSAGVRYPVGMSSNASAAAQEQRETSAPAPQVPNADTVRFLCDLAVKRQDLAERSFDALNTRLGVTFAFNSFLLPASVVALRSAMESIGEGGLRTWLPVIAAIVWAVALVTVMIATFVGFRAQEIKSLPDPLKLHRDFGTQKPEVAGEKVISTLDGAWEKIATATARKSACLNVAIGAVAVEMVVLVVLSGIPLIRHRTGEVNVANEREIRERKERDPKPRNDESSPRPRPSEYDSIIKKSENEPPPKREKE
jgi:hypothetical protein